MTKPSTKKRSTNQHNHAAGGTTKQSSSSKKKKKPAQQQQQNATPADDDHHNKTSSWLQWVLVSFVLPVVHTSLAFWWNPNHFLSRLALFVLFDSVYGAAIGTLVQPAAKYIADRYLVSADSDTTDTNTNGGVHGMSNDPTIAWPPPGAPLPDGWIEMAQRRQKASVDEPVFFLNHVRGSVRFQQAVFRLSNGCGTLLAVFVMESEYLSSVESSSLGLRGIGLWPISWVDLGWGVLVGSAIILLLFCVEVATGWIRVIGYFEVADDRDANGLSWMRNLLWDVLFHLGVSVNEEASLRGWILVYSVLWLRDEWEITSVAVAVAVATGLQAFWFASMHAGSPGASWLGLLNLVVGGVSAALNAVVCGNLWFPLGWHFGWNIWMGHLLGLSTSGIPMNAKLVSVVPHPLQAFWHGGRFGPEQSPLAPAAYLLGLALLLWIYGSGIQQGGIEELWNQKLSSSSSTAQQE